MNKITDIKPQVKNPTRCNVYLDNAFYCGLELETVMRYRLKAGDDIEKERLDEIQSDSETARAFDKALSFISLSKKTKKQVRDYLTKKGYTDKTIDRALEKMQSYAFIDDEDYARDYARSVAANKGKRLIALELKRKGVSDADASAALDELGDELPSATAVAEKYAKNKEKNRENLLKCYKYLLSKGFSYDTAKQAADEIFRYEDDNF
mgnify:FL=1